MTIAVVNEQTLEELPVACLRESSTNPRRSFDDAALTELANSIAEHGVQVPLLVRMLVEPEGIVNFYEIVAGARRYRAARFVSLASVPCIVREMTDAEAREIQIIENLQRADVLPLEEAEAFDDLLKVSGSIQAAAQRVGKEQSYVAKRLRLMALTLPSRDALRASLITIDHALLLARLAEAEQNAALKWCLDRNAGVKTPVGKVVEERLAIRVKQDEERKSGERRYFHHTWEPESVVRLKAWMEAESGILLSRAPWELTAVDFPVPGVVACSECPQNTRANTPLFGDLQMGEATCTDGACFAGKTEAFVQIVQRKAGHDETAKPKVLVPQLSWKSSNVKPSIVVDANAADVGGLEMANPAKLLKYGQWIDAKPGSCPNVRMGVTADWSDSGDRGYSGGTKKLRKPGEAVNVCIAVGCKVHPKAWEKVQPKGNQQERRDPEAEKRYEAEREHCGKIEREIRSSVLHAILGKLDAAEAVRLAAADMYAAPEWRKRLLSVMPDIAGDTLEAFVVFCCEFSGAITVSSWQLMQKGGVAQDRTRLFALAKKVGVDSAKVTAKYFHDQGSIAPYSQRLYPKGVPWPKKAVEKKAAKAKKPVAAKGAKKELAKPHAAAIKKPLPSATKARKAAERGVA